MDVVARGVGAAIGFAIGGPTGALWGWQIAGTAYDAANPQTIRGPRIGEIAAQTAQEGGPRPIVFALSPPMAGNIIFSGEPRVVRRRRRQGKGGPRVEEESVFRTYAIGVCEGPITGFWRIWRNGTLVYDASDDPQLTSEENAEFLATARLFLGTYTQTASPDIEALVSPAPAHRGTAYLVQADEDLTDLRGMIPQYQFQVLRCEGEFRTSEIYPLEELDAMDGSLALIGGELAAPPGPTIITTEMEPEALDGAGDVLGGALRDPLVTTTYTEALDGEPTVPGGLLRLAILTYEIPVEALDGVPIITDDSELRVVLITYDRDPHALDGSAELVGGSLT